MKPILMRARRTPKEIKILGQRDPRGPDNTITIWVDDTDRLHILIFKPHLACYRFKKMLNTRNSVEIIQE